MPRCVLKLTDEQLASFAAGIADVPAEAIEAVRSIYIAFESERAVRRPKCDRSGRCCHFETFGHRLFVTTIEAAAFRPAVDPRADFDGTGCPYQIDGLCAAHDVRPFGCRAYFCDPTSEAWQQTLYERFHAELRELHDRFGVAYAYVEWRQALLATGQDREAAADRESAIRPAVEKKRIALTVRPDRR